MNAQKMVLVDPTHKLPMPGQSRLFSAAGETVDLHDAFWRNLVKDGSIKAAPAAASSAAPIESTATPAEAAPPATVEADAALQSAETAVSTAFEAIESLRHPHS